MVPDPDVQYLYGWSIIIISLLNMLANILVMVWMSLRSLKLLYWKLRNRFLEWRIRKRAEEKAKKYSEVGQTSTILDQEKGKKSNDLKLEDIDDESNPTSDNRTSTKKGSKPKKKSNHKK